MIVFCPNCGTTPNYPSIPSSVSSPPIKQCISTQFYTLVTRVLRIANNTASETPRILKVDCDISKLLPLLCNLTLHHYTFIVINNYMVILLFPSLLPSYIWYLSFHSFKILTLLRP